MAAVLELLGQEERSRQLWHSYWTCHVQDWQATAVQNCPKNPELAGLRWFRPAPRPSTKARTGFGGKPGQVRLVHLGVATSCYEAAASALEQKGCRHLTHRRRMDGQRLCRPAESIHSNFWDSCPRGYDEKLAWPISTVHCQSVSLFHKKNI